MTPMKANVSAVTVEYGLHEGRFWLPRAQTVEGEAQVSFMHIPFKLEQRYTYASVNGDEPMTPVVVAARDLELGTLLKPEDFKMGGVAGPPPKGAILKTDGVAGRGLAWLPAASPPKMPKV